MQGKYRDYISGNELLNMTSALEAVATRAITLLVTDVKTKKKKES